MSLRVPRTNASYRLDDPLSISGLLTWLGQSQPRRYVDALERAVDVDATTEEDFQVGVTLDQLLAGADEGRNMFGIPYLKRQILQPNEAPVLGAQTF